MELIAVRRILEPVATRKAAERMGDATLAELERLVVPSNVRRRKRNRSTVFAKVSGLDTAAGPGWTVDELGPAWDVAIEAFGPDRLMFGSDWPVCCPVSSYGDVVSGTLDLVAELTPTERDRVLGGTAMKVYRLPLPAAPRPPDPT